MKAALRMGLRAAAGVGARGCHQEVVRSPYSPVSVPPVSVTEFVWAGIGALGDRPAFVAAQSGQRTSYSLLRSKCRGLATWLNDRMAKHSVIAVALPNSAEFAVGVLGGLEAGLVVSAMSPDFTEEELARLFRLTDTGCIVTTSKKIFTVLEAKARLEKEAGKTFPIHIISVDREVRFSGIHYLDEVVKQERDIKGCGSDAPAVVGGLSHGCLVAGCRQVSWLTQPEGTVAALPPMHELYGLTQVLLQGLSRGATLVTMGGLGPDKLVKALKQHGVTSLPAVAGLASLLASGRASKEDLSGLRSVTLSSPPGPDLARLRALLPQGVELTQVYGPETISPVFHLGGCDLSRGAVGRPLPSTEATIVDGEICVKGPQLPTNGWFHTGDAGYHDSEGYFYVTGRLAPVSRPAESLLSSRSDVSQAVVLDCGVAVVVPKEPAHTPPAKELVTYVSSNSPNQPISNVVFVKSLPIQSDGTPDRKLLHQLYADRKEMEMVAFSYI